MFENWDADDFKMNAALVLGVAGATLGTVALFRDNKQNKRIDALEDRVECVEEVAYAGDLINGRTAEEATALRKRLGF